MSSFEEALPALEPESVTDRVADHALGIELQLEELVEQRTRAEVQHRPDDVRSLQSQIDELTNELAGTAERLADELG